jgi:hypothetical protein
MLIFPPPESFVHSVVLWRDRQARAAPTIYRSEAAELPAPEEIYTSHYRILTIYVFYVPSRRGAAAPLSQGDIE